MQVVGVTNQQEVYIASKDYKFRINEILVIEDTNLNLPKCEVIETLSYNRLIPMGLDKSLVDSDVIQTLRQIGYDVESDTINLAKVRLYIEAPYPVETGCTVRFPEFEEVRNLLIKTDPERGLILGEIKGTESLMPTLPDTLKNKFEIIELEKKRKQNAVPFIFDIHSMHSYPHIGVFGGSGSGKSFGLRVIIEELMKLKIPAMVFDPHFEMSFENEDEKAPKFQNQFDVVAIGKNTGISFPDLNTKDVVDLLAASGGHLSESMVNVIQMLYKRKDSFVSFSDRLNNLAYALEEKKELERKIQNSDLTPTEVSRTNDLFKLLKEYGSLPLSSVKGVQWRLQRLDRAGLFKGDIEKIVTNLKNRKLVVVQGSMWALQIFSTYLIGALYRERRDYKDAISNGEESKFFPPFVIVTDEAHNFAPKAIDSPTKSIIKEIAQEGRKYGVFLILATQRPSLLDETITAQLNSKFIFRTVRGTDIAILREETDLTPEEGKRLPYLSSGDAFVSSAIFGRTIFTRIRASLTRSPHGLNPFEELDSQDYNRVEEAVQMIVPMLPLFDTDLIKVLQKINNQGHSWDMTRLKDELSLLANKGHLRIVKTAFATRYE